MKVVLKDVSVEIALKIGADLEEAMALVGAEKVFELYKEGAEKVGAAVVKRFMRKGYSEERINTEMVDWTPASAKVKIVDKVAKMTKLMEKLTPEEVELFKAGLV